MDASICVVSLAASTRWPSMRSRAGWAGQRDPVKVFRMGEEKEGLVCMPPEKKTRLKGTLVPT